ncbi:MAG: hypothetical protein K2X34_09375 [Hyphomonadaceae bacterium]|nr:hypothetical protein [Hyphomonadaceae bacterium]
MKVRAVILAAALAACGQQEPPAGSDTPAAQAAREYDLQVQLRRYDVMLDQVQSLTADRPGAGAIDDNHPRELARQLRETVWQYNIARSRLCARGLFTEVACGPSYEPVWIAEPADVAPTLDEIQVRSEAVGVETRRLWDAVCEDARTRVADEAERDLVCMTE